MIKKEIANAKGESGDKKYTESGEATFISYDTVIFKSICFCCRTS